MGKISKYAAINTKVKAMEKQLLTINDYNRMIELNTIPTVVDYLRSETYYKNMLSGVDPEDIGALEAVLKKYLFGQYEKIFHYFTDADKKFFKILFMRYEIENLKVFLRIIIRNEPLSRISDHIIIPKAYSTVDYTLLNNAKTLEDFIDGLEGTVYQKIISMFKDEEPDKLMFYMEMNLDRLYFSSLYSQLNQLDDENHKAIEEILGRNVDMLNLQWIYRGRRFYKISQEELINYSLKGGRIFNYAKLKDMCYREKLKDIEDIVRDSPYGDLIEDVPDFEVFLERSMERYIFEFFNKIRIKHPMTIIEPLVYMHRLEYEIRDLTTILEMKRYHLSGDQGRPYLVRSLE